MDSITKLLIAAGVLTGVVVVSKAFAGPPPPRVTYTFGHTPTQIFKYGIPTLDDAVSQAQTYANSHNETVYVYASDVNLNMTLLRTVTPAAGSIGTFLLEIFNYSGIRVFQQTFPSVDAALSYVASHYTIIVGGIGVGATGTYDIFDSTAALLVSGYIKS